jgi:hypothetical protein
MPEVTQWNEQRLNDYLRSLDEPEEKPVKERDEEIKPTEKIIDELPF